MIKIIDHDNGLDKVVILYFRVLFGICHRA